MTDSKPIELRLLGELEIRSPSSDAGPALAGQSKRLALLAHLALSPGLHRRESLLALLWPESDPTVGRRALRQALHYLRKTLGRNVFRARGSDEIGIDPGALWCDAAALEAAHAEGDHETVAELFRGELLPGFHLDDATPELERALDDARSRIRRLGLDSLAKLAERAGEEGDLEATERIARRALDVDPCDEGALRTLIDALDRRGERALAVRAYERFAERLDDELGLEPSPECRAAIRAVRENGDAPPPPRPEPRRDPLPETLPRPLTSFVGRGAAIELALELLEGPGVRILTLIGPGGMGKTRAAIEIARGARERYEDGVVYASLDAFEDAEAALAALARAAAADVREEREAKAALRERLRGRRALLVLDGLDRVPELGARVADILSALPGIDLLITSRTPIRHSAEHRLPLGPLTLPEPGRHMGIDLPLDSEAVALFVDRARAVNPRFELSASNVAAVIELCRRLDGLPLAIELAASRLGHLSVDEIVRRIEADAAFLQSDDRDRPDRHETLEATIRWTSDRLSDDERALFHGLGAFAGDFDLAVLEEVWPGLSISDRPVVELLSTLIDGGLVHPVGDDGARYRMLRTIRDHAARTLETDDRRSAWERGLARWYAEWTRAGYAHWCTPGEEEWLAALDRERINLEAVLDRATVNDPKRAAEIAASIFHWWQVRGLRSEGRRRLGSILSANGAIDASTRARLLVCLGQLDAGQTEKDLAIERMREAEAICRETGDEERLGWTLQSLGNVLLGQCEFDEALRCLEEALAIGEATGNAFRVAACRNEIAVIALVTGDLDRAESLHDEGLARARERDLRGDEIRTLLGLAQIALARGEVELAERRAREAHRLAEDIGHATSTAYANWVLADALRAGGRSGPAIHRLYARAIDVYGSAGLEDGVCIVLAALVETALDEGADDLALRLAAGVAGH
ncbi:MAG: tetratricopeptide repeat protein, partial [Gemmatimonadota bacterium]|nr:tetratricopeptide repeat protein [Gemmatimonadota bacterium]